MQNVFFIILDVLDIEKNIQDPSFVMLVIIKVWKVRGLFVIYYSLLSEK